ncbi:uncharacterized protein [Euphorbia lathyris]|uniref:uncharacterized protein n=1 Tax=Euphorbia lathyris TaxID=212925 RepID=UPI003313D342
MSSSPPDLSHSDQQNLIQKLDLFKIQGRDKRGRKVFQIIARNFPAREISCEVLNKYLKEKFFPKLEGGPFSIVYVHTDVQRSENFPGISSLRSIYEAIPINVKNNLEAVYFLHPGLQSRLFLAIFGRLLFSGGLYGKLKYVNRLEFLWDHVRRNEIAIPEFVYEHDEELEDRPMVMDYGMESDHPRVYCGTTVDNPVSSYSTRCIA